MLQSGLTALTWAAYNNQLAAMRLLLAAGANPVAADVVRRERGLLAVCPWITTGSPTFAIKRFCCTSHIRVL